MPTLLDSLVIGDWCLPNRVVLAPPTRTRASAGRVPNSMMAEYYRQRAGAGLMLTEATSVTPMGVGYLASGEQVWDAQTGKESLTLKGHIGRVVNMAYSPDGKRLASSSGSEVKVRNAQTGQELLTLIGGSDIQRLIFPDNHRLVSVAGGPVKIWDATPLPGKP